ncbi:MAG: hypothetical protein H0X66_07455 [Verrucomicrobia bacterium]|nr:hypothetical protein [Verrucomicrobiota bacterium]
MTLDRNAISKRIKQSKALKKRLQILNEDVELGISLFRCPLCGEVWQSGREWNFANEEYLFRVPAITAEEWQREHYQQPAAMMIYTAMMADYHLRPFTPSSDKCRAEGCEERASTLGVFCRRHQVEELQRLGQLPKPPSGKLFPPYYEGKEG